MVVSWKPSKQMVITHSIMEVEFVVLDKYAEKAEYYVKFLGYSKMRKTCYCNKDTFIALIKLANSGAV